MTRAMVKEQKIYTRISHATSAANLDTTAGHAPSRRTNNKKLRIKEVAWKTLFRESIAQRQAYQVWTSTTEQTRSTESQNTTPSQTTKTTTTPILRQACAFIKSLTTWTMTPDTLIHTGFYSIIRAWCTCSAVLMYSLARVSWLIDRMSRLLARLSRLLACARV